MKRHGHKSKFKHFAAGAALALLVVAAAPAGADYFAQVTGPSGGGATMGAPTGGGDMGGSSFGGGMTGGSGFGGGTGMTTGGQQPGGMTGGSQPGGQFGGSNFGGGMTGGQGGSQFGGQQMGGQQGGQQMGGQQMGGQQGGQQMGGQQGGQMGQGGQQGGSNKGGTGTFPGGGATGGQFPGGGATGGNFPGGTGVKGGQSNFDSGFNGSEFGIMEDFPTDSASMMEDSKGPKNSMNKGGMTKGGQGSQLGGSKMGGQKGGQSSFGSDFAGMMEDSKGPKNSRGGKSNFSGGFDSSEFGIMEDFPTDSTSMMEDSKGPKGKNTKSYGSRSDFLSIMEDDQSALKGKKSYGGVFDFEDTGTTSRGNKNSSRGGSFDMSSLSDLFSTPKSAGKRQEFVLEEEEDTAKPDFDAAFTKVLSGVDKIKTAKKLQTTLASRAESIYNFVCSEDNGFDCEGDNAVSKATTKLQKDLSKTKANAKTLKKDFKAYVEALRGVAEGTDEADFEE